MSNVSGVCRSFKSEMMKGVHALGDGTDVPARVAGTPDVIKAALFLASASRGVDDTVYNNTGELAGTGGYTQGGVVVGMATPPATSGSKGIFTPSANFSWSGFTSSGPFDCVLLYNASQGNKAISVHTFGTQSIVAGTFSLTMPANDVNDALLRVE